MSGMIIRIIYILTVAVVFLHPGQSFCIDLARTDIAIYRYGGAKGEGEQHFDIFQEIIYDKIDELNELLTEKTDEASYLENLRISDPIDERIKTRDLGKRWKNQNLLLAMRGIMGPESGVYWVKSKIFLGDLASYKGYLGSNKEIIVRLKVSYENYANTTDSHTLVTLYALIIDAIQKQAPKNLIGHMISRAIETIADLERRYPLKEDFKLLKAAIAQLEKDMIDNPGNNEAQ